MSFVAGKVLWMLLQPLSLALLLGLGGFILGLSRWKRSARVAAGASLLVLFLGAFTTLGHVMLQPLEATFPRPQEPDRVDGIVVLGGGMDAEVYSARGGWELNRAGDRFAEAVRLALRYPDARIVISGGIGALDQEGEAEAVAGARFLEAMGIGRDRLILEARSRNTAENAANTAALAATQEGETWLLVTSAFHMPRAVGLFRRAGFEPLPWPVDYRSTGDVGFGIALAQPAENMATTTLAVREWVGLAAYWLTGRLDTPLPRPRAQ